MTDTQTNDKPIVWLDDDDVAHYRASSIYSCKNALVMARLGYDGWGAPEWMQERYEQGHVLEPIILRRLELAHGFHVFGSQEPCSIKVGTSACIDGHVDSLEDSYLDPERYILITHLNGADVRVDGKPMPYYPQKLLIVDAKALRGETTFKSWCSGGFTNMPYYGWQQSVYQTAFEADLCMAVYAKSDEEMAGTCELGLGELRVEIFTEQWVHKTALVRKVMEIEKMARIGSETIFKEPCSPVMFPCPYFPWHPEKEKRALAGTDATEIVRMAHRREELAGQLKNLTAQKKAVEEQIAAAIGEKAESITADGWTVTTYNSGTSFTDWDAIATKTGLTVDAAKKAYTSSKKSDRLSVRVTAPKEEK